MKSRKEQNLKQTSRQTQISTFSKNVDEIIVTQVEQMENLPNSSLLNQEVESVVRLIGDQMKKFNSPFCKNCPKRKADRICIHKACGYKQYMQLICGKCHADIHAKASMKPEMDIEEYFLQLAQFVNTRIQIKSSQETPTISVYNLNEVFHDINSIRATLQNLKMTISREIKDYIPLLDFKQITNDAITQALSLCENQNIQRQLVQIKKNVYFEKNGFKWNDPGHKLNEIMKQINILQNQVVDARNSVEKSFVGGVELCIDELSIRVCDELSYGLNPIYSAKDGVLFVKGSPGDECQYYLDYKLDPKKKYRLLFSFQSEPGDNVMIGIMPISCVNAMCMSQNPSQNFYKSFFYDSPAGNQCIKIVKGKDLARFPKQGTQIEMRFDMETSYMEFCDFPDRLNINSNNSEYQIRNEPYVIAFSFYDDHKIRIHSFSEVTTIRDG